MKRQRRSFSAEFKHEAARLALDQGYSISKASQSLDCMVFEEHEKKPRYCGAFLFLVPVRGQDRFWRRERSESKAFLTVKARAYFSYASVSPAKITPLSRAQQPETTSCRPCRPCRRPYRPYQA